MEYSSQTGNTSGSLTSDVKRTAADAGDALKNTGKKLSAEMGEHYEGTRTQLREGINQAKNNFSDLGKNVSTRTREAADSTGQFVKAHPWQSIGLGAAAGLVVGMMMTRR